MKNKIIFLHILKTGGSSMRAMLLEHFGYAAIAPVPIGLSPLPREYPVIYDVDPLVHQYAITPENVSQYDVVMGHYDWGITNRLQLHRVITMFRHPVQQLFSLYRFMCSRPALIRLHPEMQKMTFWDWLGSSQVKPYLNMQTRYMSGHNSYSLDVAMRNLHSARLTFGILEHYSQSVELFNRTFKWSLELRHDNAGTDAQIRVDDYDLAHELQADDMVLYEAAYQLFMERVR